MKIGFMGGTFSPPHKGHYRSALYFAKELSLDKLIIIPTFVSPFKTECDKTASDTDRLEMSRLCFRGLDKVICDVEISDMEIAKKQTSYTVETIKQLKGDYPNDELFMYVGSDMFLSLERWKDFEDIFKYCHIYTRCREKGEMNILKSAKEKYEKLYSAKIIISNDSEVVVSSTKVREALCDKNAETYQNLLTEDVLRYIIKNGLYQQGEI